MHILVIDDEPNLCKSMKRLLSHIGHDATVVHNVEDAKDVLKDPSVRPDRILSDVVMPGATGADLHRWLCEERPELLPRFVFMSGGMPDETRHYIRTSGAYLLDKPFSLDELREALVE